MKATQKRLRDLENGQCLMQDLFVWSGRRMSGVSSPCPLKELIPCLDTTHPPVQERMEEGDEKETFRLWESFYVAYLYLERCIERFL